MARRVVVILLDNHHGPDRRVVWLSSILREAGFATRVVAWDRRQEPRELDPEPVAHGTEVIRIPVPLPWGSGGRTVLAAARFSRRVLGRRAELAGDAHAVIASDVMLLPLGRLLAWRFELPLLYDAREDWSVMEAERRSRATRAVVARLETALARHAAAVIIPGEVRAARWRSAGIEPVVLRNVGVSQRRAEVEPRWDVAMAGLISEQRRPDLFLEVARRRPDLGFVITGAGRLESWLRARARDLDNVDFLGWVPEVDDVLAASKVVVYGQDAGTAYSAVACPNTVYQAVQVRRPLVFSCGGEVDGVARRFRIGVRCEVSPESLEAAIDEARLGTGWEFDQAWQWLRAGAEEAFVARLRAIDRAAA